VHRSLVFATTAFAPLIDVARAAEAAGFHRLWTTETPTRDAVVRCQAVGAATERIQIATGIAYAFTRAPLAAATMAADVNAATGGRFALGLGTGTRGLRGRRYGVEWERPGARFAEYARLVRAAWTASDGLEFEGEFYRASVPGFALEPSAVRGLRLYGAAVNAQMLRRVLATCDGVVLHAITAVPSYFDRTVAPALNAAPGRHAALWRITSVDDDRAVARERAKRSLAFYFTTPSYGPVVAGTAWEGPVGAIRDTFRASGGTTAWSRLAELVPEDMVDTLTLAGTPEEVRAGLERLEAWSAPRGVDELVLQTVGVGLEPQEAIDNCNAIVNVCRSKG
jgi:alkanesulfonate monooxygenase SsuD/methylene tetrahydromethanopterin reductase-like flavin-dependent oxidoreductase (luciferase family)